MNRKQFLQLLAALSLAAPAAGFAGTTSAFRARRAVAEFTGELDAPPQDVFPLLCPVREYEWLDGWKCDMIFTKSGVAEENCIFSTPNGPSIWNVDHYEPPRKIEFTVVSPEMVNRLNFTLEPTPSGGTRLNWQRTFTGLNDAGNAKVNSWDTGLDRKLTRAIAEFLKTGKMMPWSKPESNR